ncbi:uncharacterized protein LOC135485097 isoform X2 [Lineus longissimus]
MRLLMRYAPGYTRLLLATVLICALGCALGLFAIISFSKTRPWLSSDDRKRTLHSMKQSESIADLKRFGMTKKEKAIVMDLLKKFHIVTRRLGMEYFIYSGTLLGSWRHHSMIPWDDDVDVIMNISCQARLLDVLSRLKPRYHVFDSYQIRFKFWSDQSKSLSQYPWKWPYLDIQFYTGNETHIWDVASEFEDVKYPRSSVFPLHKRPYESWFLPAPRDTLSVLQLNYADTPTICTTWFYSHKIEESLEDVVEIPCASLKTTYPFVHRQVVKGKMQETLKLGDKIIHVKNVDEPLNSVSEPYALRRISRRGDVG